MKESSAFQEREVVSLDTLRVAAIQWSNARKGGVRASQLEAEKNLEKIVQKLLHSAS